MKSKKSKIITFSILIIAVICSVIFAVGATDNTSEAYWESVFMDVNTYRTDLENLMAPENPNADESEDWLFAGWFTDEACTKTIDSSMQEGSAYAKFVPADILGLKAQVNAELTDNNTTNDDTGAIRFVTSVDTLNYSSIGFKIKRGSGDEEDRASNKVYQQLYATGEAEDGTAKTDKYSPSDLFNANASTYFKTWTYNKVPSSAYGIEITVTPYWVTLDGTTVTANQGMKTVNQGRSWEYVYVDDTGSDETGVGTSGKPYATLNKALSEMKANCKTPYVESYSVDATEDTEGKDGIICVKDSYTVASGYTWENHDMDVIITSDVADISKLDISDISTVVDESTLDFSAVQTVKIGDSVTFANMTLTFQENGAVYASGNRMKIASSVTSENPDTTVYGGGSAVDVSETDITILAGSYKAIYGGGRKGDVTGDTHVTLENTDVYDTTNGGQARVHGGCNKGTVTGDTYVTIGKGFNSGLGENYSDSAKSATVWGGGFSDDDAILSVVEGNTYVTVTDDARANFISGGGYLRSKVLKTSHVIFEGGYAMSIYGGSAASSAAANLEHNGINSNTSVVMTGGQVAQVFGGNEYGDLEGNTSVQILGGTVTRRIFGGCYNNYARVSDDITDLFNYEWKNAFSVKGYSSVTIGTGANVNLSDDSDYSLCAVSRREENSENEIGVLVLNSGKENTKYGFNMAIGNPDDLPTNFLVTAGTGGSVYGECAGLRIVPGDNKVATVRVGSTTGSAIFYTESEGICTLPELTDRTSIQKLYVVFTDEKPADVSTDNYEAKTNGAYYNTLEAAVSAANVLAETSDTAESIAVTLLKDADVDQTLTINDFADITVQSDTNATSVYTVTYSSTDNNLFEVEGKLAIENLNLSTGKTGIHLTTGSEGTATNVNVTRLNAVADASNALVIIDEGAAFTLNEDNGTSSINGNSYAGRGVAVDGTFVLNGGTVKNNVVANVTTEEVTTTVDGAGVYVTGTFTMNGGTISDNTSENDGAGVHITSSGSFTMNDGYIQNNTATACGAGVSVRGTFIMNDGTIQLNSANKGAGAIVRSEATDVELNGGNICDNAANADGGGIFIQSSDIVMNNITIEKNTAINGGGMYVGVSKTLTMDKGTIQNNTATYGAGVYVNKGTFAMAGGTISGHGSSEKPCSTTGAGVFVNAGTFNMSAGTIEDNHTTGNGAGVVVKPDATFTMSGGTIQGNTTSKANGGGGGIFTQSLNTTITGNAVIQNNTATSSGGGVYVHQSSGVLTMTGGTVYNNQAEYGGGIYIANNTADVANEISGGEIKGNTATGNGGGVYTLGKLNMTGGSISEHGTTEARNDIVGAGLYVASGATFTLSGDEAYITNNHSSVKGAGVAVEGTFNMNGGNITYNTSVNASKASNGEGAGIYVLGTGVVTMTGGSISYNEVSGSGAGVSVSETSKFIMENGEISHNTATGSGGGIIVRSTRTETIDEKETQVAAFVMNGGELSENKALVTSGNGGGAIFQSGGTIAEISDGIISGNTSQANGGAVFVNATLTMTGGTIEDNTATGNGAGVYVNSGSAHFKLQSKGTISGNHTTANGAGVAVAGKLSMSGGYIQNNTTTADGGGVYVLEGGTFVMNTSTGVSGNTAVNGGGVYINGGTFTMKKGPISGNTATISGGGVYVNGGTFETTTTSDKTITSNVATTAGAGVCVNAGTFNMQHGTISNHGTEDNRSTSIGAGVYVASGAAFNMSGEDARIEYNYNSKNGAGVYVDSTVQEDGSYITGTFTMSNGIIQYNNTAENGAGIFLNAGVGMTMSGGSIVNNRCSTTRKNGGAICATGSNVLTLKAGEISGNSSAGTVQGVFMQSAGSTSQVILYTEFVIGNEIRYNGLSTRGTDNPVLIVYGDSLSDTLNLGFHNTGTVYVQCDSATAAAQIYSKINQYVTSWALSHEENSSYIKATK